MFTPRCILLVENDPELCSRLSRLIELTGFHTVVVDSCSAAREVVRVRSFPVVIVDGAIDGGAGINLIADMRRFARRTTILLLQSFVVANELAKGLAAGADDYLSAHASDEELLIRIRSAERMNSGSSERSPDHVS